MRYIAYAVDLSGVARTAYELESADDAEAKRRAQNFLEAHPSIELWKGVRLVARLTRDKGEEAVIGATVESGKIGAAT